VIILEFVNDFTKPYIFLSGEGMLIEGTVSIIVWEKDRIILKAREKITLCGENLSLNHKGHGSVFISGRIFSLEFSLC